MPPILRETFLMSISAGSLWDRDAFISELKSAGQGEGDRGEAHPLIAEIEAGRATPTAVKRWIAARYYHQTLMPRQDALIVANCPVREVRRVWIERIMDHDGRRADQGGIGAWLQLGEAAGLSRRDLEEHRQLPPGAREATDEQVSLAEKSPWPVAIAATLADLASPELLREPIAAFEKHYTWIDGAGLGYFRAKGAQTARNTASALDCVVRYCDTPELQRRAVEALERKCDLLRAMLDAVGDRQGESPRATTAKAAAGR